MADLNSGVLEAINDLRRELRALSDRLARVESGRAQAEAAPVAVEAPAIAPEAPRPEPIAEEILLVMSAAVAAFLGERAHIRQVRLISSSSWALQGRVSIQASHYFYS